MEKMYGGPAAERHTKNWGGEEEGIEKRSRAGRAEGKASAGGEGKEVCGGGEERASSEGEIEGERKKQLPLLRLRQLWVDEPSPSLFRSPALEDCSHHEKNCRQFSTHRL